MTLPETDPPAPSLSVSLPVRVPMERFFSALKSLLGAPGPFVSFYLPILDDEARAASLDSLVTAENLTADQKAFGRGLLRADRVADDAMIVGLLASDGSSFVQSFPEGPDEAVIDVGALPRLASVIEAEQRLRHHILAVVSDEGVDVMTFPRHGQATLHRAAPGDVEYATLLIAEAAKQTETPLVLIAAADDVAEDLVQRVTLEVSIETRVESVPVDADANEGADLDQLAERAVQTVATDRATAAVQNIRTWKFERSHGLGAGGVQAALQSLRDEDVRMVLVTDDLDDQRQAWFGTDPAAVAVDLEDASTTDVEGAWIPARLVDVVLRSALLRDIPVSVMPDLPDDTLRDGVGVVRSMMVTP